ncbi:MAG: Zn-ribbon domain-containing OB-fold protein, partial [Candidatus Zixiibacteriota bacterium]
MFPARVWREIPQRYRLEANKCPQTGEIYFPPRLVCPEGKCVELEPLKLAETGTIESYTVIRVAPSAFTDQAPYAIGIVKLDDG